MFTKAALCAAVTFVFDFTFHLLATRPMETLTYFVIKFLLAFFVASAVLALMAARKKAVTPLAAGITGLVFSTLMSTYYRAWELGEAAVPFGSRAPDIIGIDRTNLLFFSGTWWLGHALFFAVGILVADALVKKLSIRSLGK